MEIRSIIFRGKKLDDGEWVQGYYYKLEKDRMVISSCIKREAYEVNPETVGQFTGLTDDMGRKLFEGDIVKAIDSYTDECDEESLGVVKFSRGAFCVDWNTAFYEPLFLTNDDDKDLVVVGNIYDNPELLEVR